MDFFDKLSARLSHDEGVRKGKMFGWDAMFVHDYAFVCYRLDEGMLFKLAQKDLDFAIQNPGVVLFDPMGNGKGMKGWVFAGKEAEKIWEKLAILALEFCKKLPPKPKAPGKSKKKD